MRLSSDPGRTARDARAAPLGLANGSASPSASVRATLRLRARWTSPPWNEARSPSVALVVCEPALLPRAITLRRRGRQHTKGRSLYANTAGFESMRAKPGLSVYKSFRNRMQNGVTMRYTTRVPPTVVARSPKRVLDIVVPVVSVAAVLSLWELVTRTGVVSPKDLSQIGRAHV